MVVQGLPAMEGFLAGCRAEKSPGMLGGLAPVRDTAVTGFVGLAEGKAGAGLPPGHLLFAGSPGTWAWPVVC